MKPNFQELSLSELRVYVLEHREDNEAFYALIDRYKVTYPNRTKYPAPKTPEDREEMRRIIREKLS